MLRGSPPAGSATWFTLRCGLFFGKPCRALPEPPQPAHPTEPRGRRRGALLRPPLLLYRYTKGIEEVGWRRSSAFPAPAGGWLWQASGSPSLYGAPPPPPRIQAILRGGIVCFGCAFSACRGFSWPQLFVRLLGRLGEHRCPPPVQRFGRGGGEIPRTVLFAF